MISLIFIITNCYLTKNSRRMYINFLFQFLFLNYQTEKGWGFRVYHDEVVTEAVVLDEVKEPTFFPIEERRLRWCLHAYWRGGNPKARVSKSNSSCWLETDRLERVLSGERMASGGGEGEGDGCCNCHGRYMTVTTGSLSLSLSSGRRRRRRKGRGNIAKVNWAVTSSDGLGRRLVWAAAHSRLEMNRG